MVCRLMVLIGRSITLGTKLDNPIVHLHLDLDSEDRPLSMHRCSIVMRLLLDFTVANKDLFAVSCIVVHYCGNVDLVLATMHRCRSRQASRGMIPLILLHIILRALNNVRKVLDKLNESNASSRGIRQSSACPPLSLSLIIHRLLLMPLCVSIIALYAFFQHLRPEP